MKNTPFPVAKSLVGRLAATSAAARGRLGGSFATFAFRRFVVDQGLRVAAALAYTSLLALIPLAAIGLAILMAFPVFEDVRVEMLNAALANLLPEMGEQVAIYFYQFLDNTGRMTAVGVVGLAVTALMLLATIEAAINRTFRVAQPRLLLVRVLLYWALLTLGPLVVGTSFSLSGYILAVTRASGIEAELAAFTSPLGGVARVVPALLMVVAFTLFYKAMPNRPVRWRDALAGGVLAGLVFAFLRWGFSLYIVYFPTYATLYGALSVMPIFLVWLYLSWAVVLAGATVTAALPEWRTGARESGDVNGPAARLTLACRILEALWRQGRSGGALGRGRLLAETGAADRALDEMLAMLTAAGWIVTAATGGYVLARNPETATLAELVRQLGVALDPVPAFRTAPESWRRRLAAALDDAATAGERALSATLKDVFAGGPSVQETGSVSSLRRTS